MNCNAAMLKQMRDEGLSLDACIRVIEAGEEAPKPRSKAAERQARYRKNKAEGVTSNVTTNVTPPLKESNIQNPSSVSNETGGEAADPVKDLFDLGVSILMASGTPEKQARSLLGKWRKGKSDAEVLAALLDCRARSISNPVEWLEARFKTAKWVSASGYEYRGSDKDVLREAERRGDNDTYWRVKSAMKERAA